MTSYLEQFSPAVLVKIIQLQTAVTKAGLDLDLVMKTIVDLTHNLLENDGCVIELLEGSEMVYRAVSGAMLSQALGMRLKADTSLSGRCVREGKTLRCEDTGTDPRVDRAACQNLGVGAMLVMPLKTKSETAGVLKVMWKTPRKIGEHEENILEVIASTLTNALKNAEDARARELELLGETAEKRELQQQKEFLAALLENVSEGIVACDSQGTLRLFNRVTREWHGLPEEPLPSDQWAQYYSLFQRDGVTPMRTEDIPLFRAFKGELVRNYEMIISAKGQPPRICLANGEAIYDENGEKVGAVVVMHDVTEQRMSYLEIHKLNLELEQKVSERTKELQIKSDALENSLNGFDIVNHRGEIVYANAAYLKMWGYQSLDEIRGTSPAGHCADPETPLKIIGELKRNGECSIEFKAKRKDGSLFDVLMWAWLAHDSQGNEIYPTTSIDVTQSKMNQERLMESIRSRDEFLSVASHELKTPLTSLKMNTQIRLRKLEKGDASYFEGKKMADFFQGDLRQIERLTHLIDDMLDISRINTGKLQVHPERCDLSKLVSDSVSRFNDQIDDREEKIRFTSSGPVVGNWDRFRMEQVMANLLTNALKYGKDGPIAVSLTHQGNHAVLKVKDSGIGIPKDSLRRIFLRFERAVAPGEVAGMGLGLYIVNEIVELHHGTVTAESELGQGSTFTVRLPVS